MVAVADIPAPPRPGKPPAQWSVVVPFYNEEAFLGATLASLAAQSERRVEYILVDNGSTDGSAQLAREFQISRPDLDVVILEERTPGKASALAAGVAAATAPYTAVCDADTIYPARYLETAHDLFERGGADTVAVLAFGVDPSRPRLSRLLRAKGALAAALMPRQAHSGGYGQCFRTAALRAVGGFSPNMWPYCLMDHEIIQRLTRIGRIRHDYRHWCAPSARRTNRRAVRWTLFERVLYHVTPHAAKDWFFYRFLSRRFHARGVGELNLRRKDWSPHVAQAAARSRSEQIAANRATSASK
jgi:glycosyltransferase involved in cell wall biosynthesis